MVLKSHIRHSSRALARAGILICDVGLRVAQPNLPCSNAELYFFLDCGKNRSFMSPLAYHANKFKLEEGYLSDATKEIIDMSMDYLDVKDPKTGQSFLDIARENLKISRELKKNIEAGAYKKLLLYVGELRNENVISER